MVVFLAGAGVSGADVVSADEADAYLVVRCAVAVELFADDVRNFGRLHVGAGEYVDLVPALFGGVLGACTGAFAGRVADALVPALPVPSVYPGHSKVLIPVREPQLLRNISLDKDILTALSNQISCNGFFPFAILNNQDEFATRGRMFAPAIGIDEDPVTGNANGPAGAYLHHYDLLIPVGELTYCAHQGHEMGKPGTVFVSLNDQYADRLIVKISGNAVSAGTLTFDV